LNFGLLFFVICVFQEAINVRQDAKGKEAKENHSGTGDRAILQLI
jgi:hypothetical protein